MEPIHRSLAHIWSFCGEHHSHCLLIGKSFQQSICPFMDPTLWIDQQEKCLERSGTEPTRGIDGELATLELLHDIIFLLLLNLLSQESVDLGIRCKHLTQVERA